MGGDIYFDLLYMKGYNPSQQSKCGDRNENGWLCCIYIQFIVKKQRADRSGSGLSNLKVYPSYISSFNRFLPPRSSKKKKVLKFFKTTPPGGYQMFKCISSSMLDISHSNHSLLPLIPMS